MDILDEATWIPEGSYTSSWKELEEAIPMYSLLPSGETAIELARPAVR